MTSTGSPVKNDPRWGMVVDINRCVGCQTCTVACKHWNDTQPGVQWRSVIDIETGHYPDVERFFLVIGCQHCAAPPCVPVCPTGATRQRNDGLVTMDYDTCIGCGACAVACPYDARTIAHEHQWYYGQETSQEASARHPEREGVAQKCTFCADKIDDARTSGRTPGIDLEVPPACAASCISSAIHFGDFNDPVSNVSTLTNNQAFVRLNEDLGTDPQIRYLYSTPTVPGRDTDAADFDDQQLADPANPLVGKHQRFWDWRAAMNWCLGGLAGGLAASAWCAYLADQLSAPAIGRAYQTAAVLMLIGLFFVWLKIGRRWRAWRALWRPQSSWMTRELYSAATFLGLTLAITLDGGRNALLHHIAGLAAAAFLICQARILYSAKGIPAWRTACVPWLIIASGLLEGLGLSAMLVWAEFVAAPAQTGLTTLAWATLVLVVLNVALWLAYRLGTDRKSRPPLANRSIDAMSWPLHLVGHVTPSLLIVTFVLGGGNPALLALAGIGVIAGGAYWKFGVILNAAYQHGFSLTRLPQRGSGSRAAPSLTG